MQKVAFYDELGNQQEFIVKAKFSLDDVDYVAMLPADEIYAPTYILRVDIDDSGEELLVGIEDDELEEVSQVYEELKKDIIQ